ncbi:MAG: hypothetical protein M1575_04205 [Patescibacteria group bacterium]|nr:hypothetical protein [Patescibacteria group bacterium]MCL5095893.1 hypothetical protein [Patescibacteria group bacterium]
MKKIFVITLLSIFFFLSLNSAEAIVTNSIRVVPTPTPTLIPVRQIETSIVTPTPTPFPAAVRKLNTTVNEKNLEIDTSKIRQERMLNPQPEPPIFVFDSLEIKKTEKTSTLTWPAFSSLETVKSNIIFNPEGALVEIPQKLSGSSGTINFLIKPEFKISGNKTLLFSEGKELELKSLPTVIYRRLNSIFFKNNIKPTGDFTLDVLNGKAVYWLTVKQPIKLLGFIPLEINSKVTVADQDGKASVTDKPWYAFLGKEMVDIVAEFSKLPNLVVTGLRFEPSVFGNGEEVKVIATVVNEGFGAAYGFPDIINHNGGPMKVLRFLDEGGSVYEWSLILVYLEPGQTTDYDFTIDKITCGRNIRVEIAYGENSLIEEPTKEDNLMSAKLDCQK